MTQSTIVRGQRRVPRIDLATASWTHNPSGAALLTLSRDPVSGAETFALRCPPNFVYAEQAHFYDCEQELFQFEGEFHHDEVNPYHANDYIYRPIGTVYGHGEGSFDGGITIASLARSRRRFHFQDHPEPWTGHYLVDRLWNARPVQPFIVNLSSLAWEPLPGWPALAMRALRGKPGERSQHSGARQHSPWAADAALVLRLPVDYVGSFPHWPDFALETLVLTGKATIGGQVWHRGCYAFDALSGQCRVHELLEVYVRVFATSV